MTDPLLPELIALYLAACRVEGKSSRTLQAYGWTLDRFQRALAEDGAPDDVRQLQALHVIPYLDRSAHLARETRHRYFREVRCFFAWCQRTRVITDSPFQGLRNVSLPRRIVQPYRPEEVAGLLAVCDASPMGQRDRALMLTLLDTGVRCAEAVGLDLADADFARRRLHVRHGKGHTERVVPFADRCAAALVEYLDHRGRSPGPLFVAARYGRLHPDTRLQPNGLKQLLRRRGREAGIAKIHAHRFRHTFATWAIAHQARELDVQHLLGHAGPEMLRRYTATYRAEQAAEHHARYSPADRMLASDRDEIVGALRSHFPLASATRPR